MSDFFDTCQNLQPADTAADGEGPDETVLRIAGDLRNRSLNRLICYQ